MEDKRGLALYICTRPIYREAIIDLPIATLRPFRSTRQTRADARMGFPTSSNVLTSSPATAPPPTCYICLDPATPDSSLLCSPCGQCLLHVHRSCLETHLTHIFRHADGFMSSDGPPPHLAWKHLSTIHVFRHGPDDLSVCTPCTVCRAIIVYRTTHASAAFAETVAAWHVHQTTEVQATALFALIYVQQLVRVLLAVPVTFREPIARLALRVSVAVARADAQRLYRQLVWCLDYVSIAWGIWMGLGVCARVFYVGVALMNWGAYTGESSMGRDAAASELGARTTYLWREGDLVA